VFVGLSSSGAHLGVCGAHLGVIELGCIEQRFEAWVIQKTPNGSNILV